MGGNCGTGAIGGAASAVLGNLHDQMANTSNGELPQQDKEARLNLIESVVAGITAGVSNDATATSIAAALGIKKDTYLSRS